MTRKSGIYLLASLILGAFMALGSAQAGAAVEGSAKADKLEQCVRPTPYMRRNHFEVIKHQRDVTVYQGVRDTKDSLAQCVDCHGRYDSADKPVPVNAEGQFCADCHHQVAVTIDCFSCHTTVPGGK